MAWAGDVDVVGAVLDGRHAAPAGAVLRRLPAKLLNAAKEAVTFK
jgi:hypothetical protein